VGLIPVNISPSNSVSRAWWVYLVILATGLPIYYFVTSGLSQNFLYDGYGVSAALAILIGVRLHHPVKRGPWLMFSGGLSLFALGDVVFNIYALRSQSVSTPSTADFLYLAAYPVLGIGMIALVRSRAPRAGLISALDGIMVALAVGVLAWVFVLGHYARDESMSVGARLTAIAYPSLDLLLVVMIVRLVFGGGVRNLSYRLLLTSVGLLLVTDGLYAMATLHSWYSFSNATPLDAGWLMSYALWGAAALHPSMKRLTDEHAEPASRRTWGPIILLGIAAMTAPMVIIVRGLMDHTSDDPLLAGASVVIFGLVLVRLWLVTKNLDAAKRYLEFAVERQTILTRAAEAFVGSSDVEAVAEAVVKAAVSLAHGPGSWSTYTVAGPSGRTVVSASGNVPPGTVGAARELGLASRSRLRNALHHPVRSNTDGAVVVAPVTGIFAGPVLVDNELRGRLDVGYDAGNSPDLSASLELLCVEMGLALKSIEISEERHRARGERRFRSMVQKSSELVTLIRPDNLVIYQSPSVSKMLGRAASQIVGINLEALIHPDDVPLFREQLRKVQMVDGHSTIEFECRLSHLDGTWRNVDCFMTNLLDDPDVGAIVLNCRDVTERRLLEQELHHQAFHDSLTGLANRALFLDRLSHALHRAEREAVSVAVLFLDIDDFKTINDSIGHEAGDRVLIAVGERIQLAIRPGDSLARLGGDEFAVLLDFGDMPESAELVANRIAEQLGQVIQVGDESLVIRASIGIALNVGDTLGPDELLRNADLAMYMAKRAGQGRFEVFEQSMYNQAVRRYDLASELRQALDGEGLEVYYQPIVSAQHATPVGAEALIRWNHPRYGMTPAIEFVEIAESTGLIVQLGEWVLNQACAQAQIWRAADVVDDSFYVSVNLSARQLVEPGVVESVRQALKISGLPARALVLEITESTLMLDYSASLTRLSALKALGLALALDDYGTGYSSLNRLANLPVDIVKIDKSFIDQVTSDRLGRALVQSIIDVTSALGMTSVAEGVEIVDQLEALVEMGCNSIQGYLFARPMTSVDAAVSLHLLRSAQPTTA
jgi:diguanylate cyclase (GGDEF)-like protein/PAS domain S-box-containing protein